MALSRDGLNGIALTGVVAVAVTLINGWVLTGSMISNLNPSTKEVALQAPASSKLDLREPAQLLDARSKGSRSIPPFQFASEVVRITADSLTEYVQVQANFVRLKLERFNEVTSVRNLRNGLRGEVFRDINGFTTDLIQLELGQNEFVLLLQDPKQNTAKERKLIIERVAVQSP
jgi:hypothetical protein